MVRVLEEVERVAFWSRRVDEVVPYLFGQESPEGILSLVVVAELFHLYEQTDRSYEDIEDCLAVLVEERERLQGEHPGHDVLARISGMAERVLSRLLEDLSDDVR